MAFDLVGKQTQAEIFTANLETRIENPPDMVLIRQSDGFGYIAKIPFHDAVFLPFFFSRNQSIGIRLFDKFFFQVRDVPSGHYNVFLGIGDGNSHFKMIRQGLYRPDSGRNIDTHTGVKKSAEGRGQGAVGRGAFHR